MSENTAGPLPLPPVITMVLTLHKLVISASILTRTLVEVEVDASTDHNSLPNHTHAAPPTDILPSACADAIAQCNHLAVSVLGMLKSSEVGRGMSAEVQGYAQLMTQAGKGLNKLIKMGIAIS